MRCDEALDVQVIGIRHQPHHRHLVIRITTYVGEHDEARLVRPTGGASYTQHY